MYNYYTDDVLILFKNFKQRILKSPATIVKIKKKKKKSIKAKTKSIAKTTTTTTIIRTRIA